MNTALIHTTFELLAFAGGYRLYTYLRSQTQDDYTDHQRLILLIAATLGALLGSRLLATFDNYPLLLAAPYSLSTWYGQKTIAGGLLGGTLFVELVKKRFHYQRSSGDILVYPIILGVALGRVGCHFHALHDQTYGLPTQLPWGMDFGDGIARHPTSLYEIMVLLGIGAALFFYERFQPLKNGQRYSLLLLGYCTFRVFVEFLKPRHIFIANLSIIQLTCLFSAGYFLWALNCYQSTNVVDNARQEL